MIKVAIKIGEKALKVGGNPQSNNVYKMIPPFPNTASFKKYTSDNNLEEYIIIIHVKENNPPMTTIATTDKDMTRVDHLFNSMGIKSDAEVLKKLFGYELLNTKPETSKLFGTILSEL